MTTAQPITEILAAAETRDESAAERLFPLLYAELRALAQAQPAAAIATIRPTELVHEAYLRLVTAPDRTWENRRHFVCTAGLAMRQILVDRARARRTAKRGGGKLSNEPLLDAFAVDPAQDAQLVQVDDALTDLAELDERAAKVVTLRFYLGLTETEVADALGVTDRTVRRDWVFARSWLARHLGPARGGGAE